MPEKNKLGHQRRAKVPWPAMQWFLALAGCARALPAQQVSAAQGQAIFEEKGGCLKCHRVRGAGSRLGPDLTDIGNARSPEELQKSLREPDAEVLPQNRYYRLVTRDGSVITGRLLNQDTFTLQLMDASERLLSFQKSTLREYGLIRNSAMPSYEGKLTPGEMADVVAYLSSLKGVKPQ